MKKVESTPAEILQAARARGSQTGLRYAGAVTPEEAYALVSGGAATLVDVRTRFESEYVGRVPDTPLIEWRSLGAPAPNPEFLSALAALGDKEQNYLFLCRSGVRSHAAAELAASHGYTGAFNILEGFEGDLDEQKHRGGRGGWRLAGLPWIQN